MPGKKPFPCHVCLMYICVLMYSYPCMCVHLCLEARDPPQLLFTQELSVFSSVLHPTPRFLFFFSFLKTASHYVAEASLKLREIHLPLPPKFWDSWHASAYQPTCDTTVFTSSSLFCLFCFVLETSLLGLELAYAGG